MTISNVEWLEADGLGGFASGTSTGLRTRRYHALLLVATTPPTGRVVLVNGLEAWVETASGRYAISSQRYAPDVVHPDGVQRLTCFVNDPWPRWTFTLEDGTVVEQELIVRQGAPITAISWRLRHPKPGIRLVVRPLMSGRDYHSTHHENGAFAFASDVAGERVTWQPYPGVPATIAMTSGEFTQEPDWFRNFEYDEERSRGLDSSEDLASPGTFTFQLDRPALLLLTTAGTVPADSGASTEDLYNSIRQSETTRRAFASPLHRAADAYLVHRHTGKTIVAGYPWFTDWGRDTFIAVRGLCLATGRLEEARDILHAWAGTVSEGMLPNRFPDVGDSTEFNSVDASLWYVVAVHDFFQAAAARGFIVRDEDAATLRGAVEAILDGYARGTRFGIGADADGLLACGVSGSQLTWMDAKIGDWVVTPRIGKPVEIQALWLNALAIARQWSSARRGMLEAGTQAFQARFWNEHEGALYDVIDVDHVPGTTDATIRPNQIFAVGGLPLMLLDKARGRRVVDLVESRLVTPSGLRSLAPGSPGYAGRYEGDGAQRDARYHQGTVWPWLLGPFVEAWLRVRRPSARARAEARERFLQPILAVAAQCGGHLSEIADGDPPHTPRGCPQQAWSVGEILRLEQLLNGQPATSGRVAPRADRA
jgi:predicted glycogen debranching enzyme